MLPRAFEERMQRMLGEEYPAFESSYEKDKYQALRVNTLKADKEIFVKNAPFSLNQVPWETNGFYYDSQDTPGKHPYHEAGVYYIQEPSAMAPVPFLEVKPGDRVLDLCAAPGGKSTQIAVALKGKGLLVCNEIHPARAKILSENIERMGVRNAVVTNESPEKLEQYFAGYFDKILVDAPCSGEGMFRKNEEAKNEWSPENVQICADRQAGILDCAANMLRPGGRLVYSTCTFAPAENEGSIAGFLERHPEYKVISVERPEGFESGKPEWFEFTGEASTNTEKSTATYDEEVCRELEKTLRIWPHKVNGEGHYLAVLEKEGILDSSVETYALYGVEKGMKEKDCKELQEFLQDTLQVRLEGVLFKFGEQIYLGPVNMPSVKNLKVLRPGLHLGTLKKNRFEPSHALALTLTPAEVKRCYELSAEKGEATAFIGGQTFSVDTEKGWHLITVDGYSLGWGKAAGGIMKNHYPKGLRKF